VQAITAPLPGTAAVTAVGLAADGLLQPVEGLAIAIVAIRLLKMRGEAPAPTEMARTLAGESG
jgi:hypothetical protein